MYKDLVRKFKLYHPQINLFMVLVLVVMVLGIRQQVQGEAVGGILVMILVLDSQGA
jgi:Na+/citrate or Na+/malate symporter